VDNQKACKYGMPKREKFKNLSLHLPACR